MLRRLCFSLIVASVVLFPAARAGVDADNQYKFAESLQKDGDYAFALLEYKRFRFLYPNDAKSGDAAFQVATINLTYLGNVTRARALLEDVKTAYPNTDAANRAKSLADFIDVNSDFGGKPLLAYLKGKQLENRQDFDAAVAAYTKTADDYPQARLADDSLIDAARVSLESLSKAAEAKVLLDRAARTYPDSERLSEIQYMQATVTEKGGDARAAIAAYDAVAPGKATDPYRIQAAAAVDRIKRQANVLERQFDKNFVRTYRLVGTDDTRAGEFVANIELATTLSNREVEATMEDALLALYEKRKKPEDKVRVDVWFTYRITNAGQALWAPGGQPTYTVKPRKNEDVLKDVLFDMFK